MSKPRLSFRQVIFMLLSILIMILIFYFSSENADDSTTSSNFIVNFIVKVFFPKMNTYPINKQTYLILLNLPLGKLHTFLYMHLLGSVYQEHSKNSN